MSVSTKLSLCSNNAQSHFLQVSKTCVMLLEILPFLTQSQKDGGESCDWFTNSHLQELIALLKQNNVKQYSSYQDPAAANCDKRLPSRFIVTGSTLRAACVFRRRNEDDICLIPKKSKGSGGKFQQMNKLVDKLIIHVCPKPNSTLMNVSQLVHSDANDNADNEQISKYFQPITSH